MFQNKSVQLHSNPNDLGIADADAIELSAARPHHMRYPFLLQEESPVLHYRRILIKRKWWIILTVVVVFSLVSIKTLTTVPLYQATSKIAIFPERSNVLGFKDNQDTSPVDYDVDVTLETQAAILRSDALAMNVIESMRLDENPRFGGVVPTKRQSDSAIRISGVDPDPARIAGFLDTFRGGLHVQIIPNSRLVQISYTHSDPKLASEIANGLVKTFVEQNFKTKYEAVTQTSDWLSKELLDLQMKVETSEEKLVRYQKDHSILGIDDKQNIVMAKLDELNRELTAAQSDRIQKESNYKFATSADPGLFARAAPSEPTNLLAKLQEKEADLSTQLALTTTMFGSGYPKVTELSNQLKEVKAEIAAQEKVMQEKLRNEYLGALQREALLNSAFEQQKQEANKLNESAIEYSVLKRDADSNRQLHDNLLQRLKEAGVSAGLRSSEIRVVDIARTPGSPITPDVPRNLTLGFLVGLAGGIGLAFLIDALDRTVCTIDEVTAISMLPALGTIPLQIAHNGNSGKRLKAISDDGNGPALVTFVRPRSEAAEAFRALRTSILLSSYGKPPKVILVTSALPQEGKTTIGANSAIVLAQRGSRVLLIDGDLRRPGVSRLFGLRPHGGLSTVISGVDKFEDVVVPHPEIPNLCILPAGPIPPQPAELLSSAAMKDHLESWRKVFDHIIIDTPPCLSVTDAVVLSPEADRVLLVARSAQTTKIALRRVCELLSQVNANVMGVVLNALNLRALDGYSYHSSGGPYTQYYVEDATHSEAEASSKVS